MTFNDDMIVSSVICSSYNTKIRMLARMVIELQCEFNDNIFKFTEISVFTVSCDSKSSRYRLWSAHGKAKSNL